MMSQTTVQTSPIQVKKLGHLVYEVSDIHRSTRFWTEIMGFSVSDVNERGMVFLRCGHDHHAIGLFEVPGGRLPEQGLRMSHLAMEVANMDELFKARTFLHERGIKLTFEGRKGPGGNAGLEFEDPDGYTFEIYTQMDQIELDGITRPADQWTRVKSLEDAVKHPLPLRW
jgi:catechol 2,3-dioxygenase-like lactoylglutathione lyase family enzyme